MSKLPIKTGDLIYIPSEVTLYQKEKTNTVSAHKKIKTPINVLVTNVSSKTYEVYFQNGYWLVDRDSAYQLQEKL